MGPVTGCAGRWRRRRPVAVVALGSALVLLVTSSGCGIAAQSDAEPIPADDVPFGLLDEQQTPATSRTGQEVEIFMVAGERVAPVRRFLPAGPDLDEIADSLAAGPTEAERSLGLSSSLPTGQLGSVTSARGVALVDLRASFADLRPRDQSLAIAQLVFTLTGRPGIGRVSITLDGEAIEVPRGDGALTIDALARDDFSSVAPP